jgi:hypothetical protein
MPRHTCSLLRCLPSCGCMLEVCGCASCHPIPARPADVSAASAARMREACARAARMRVCICTLVLLRLRNTGNSAVCMHVCAENTHVSFHANALFCGPLQVDVVTAAVLLRRLLHLLPPLGMLWQYRREACFTVHVQRCKQSCIPRTQEYSADLREAYTETDCADWVRSTIARTWPGWSNRFMRVALQQPTHHRLSYCGAAIFRASATFRTLLALHGPRRIESRRRLAHFRPSSELRSVCDTCVPDCQCHW